MEFLIDSLRSNRQASYAELQAKAHERHLKVFPILYGRAKAMLGISKAETEAVPASKAVPANKGVPASKAGGNEAHEPGPRAAGWGSKSARIRELLDSGMNGPEIARQVGASTALVYAVKSSLGKTAKRRASAPREVPGPGRPPREVQREALRSGTLQGLDGVLDAIKHSERDRNRLRAALERLHAILEGGLNGPSFTQSGSSSRA
jgi:hypothetical protein